MAHYKAVGSVIVSIAALGVFVSLIRTAPHPVGAMQAMSSMPSTTMSGPQDPVTAGIACNSGLASVGSSTLYNKTTTSGVNTIWKCSTPDGVTFGWQAPYTSTAFQNQDWSLQPGLFATGTARSNVYYEVNAVTLLSVTSREEGSPICTAAPVLSILDLGTSPSTAYGSATVIYSQTLSTSNTVVSNTGLSIAVAAGHYLGIGFSTGACVTPPTISVVATLQ